MHEFGRASEEFVDSLDHIIICLDIDLESFKVNIWAELRHVFVKLVNDVIHEGKDVVFIPFQARQVCTIVI